jgi:Zn-dependent protease
MLRLKKFLCACFGNVALVFILVSVSTIPHVFQARQAQDFQLTPQEWTLPRELLMVLTDTLARLIFLLPLVLGVLYGMAWWTVKNGKPSGRKWAIAASVAMILQGIPQIVITFLAWHQLSGLALEGFLALDATMLGIAVPALIVFAPRNSMAQAASQAANLPRIAGDGTSRILDTVAWLVQIAGYIYGMSLWNRWGHAQDLPWIHGVMFWAQFVIAILFTILVHELGHAGVGRALGMRVRSLVVGPFHWRVRQGRWKFEFVATRILSAQGGAGVVPSSPAQNRWDEICMIAAGPMVNLFTGVLAMCAALAAKGQPWEQYWRFLALIATISFITFAGNLIPFRPEGAYSDGARIYQLLRGGPLVDLQRAFNLASSTQVSSVRPRDYDIQALQRAAAAFAKGHHALMLRLIASEYFLDKGDFPPACEALADAEAVYHQSASDMSAEPLTVFIFGNALLRRDAANARQWWERMEAKKTTEIGVNYWLARGALQWIEGHPKEAREALEKGEALAQKSRPTGSDEFDTCRLGLLRDALEEAPEHLLCAGVEG